MKAAVYVIQAQPEKYGADFDTTMSYLDQMVMKNGIFDSICLYCKNWNSAGKVSSGCHYREVEYKIYPKAVWNFMTKKQQMQITKLKQEQDINPATRLTSTEARGQCQREPRQQLEKISVRKKQRESCSNFQCIRCKLQRSLLSPRVIKWGCQN